MSWQVAFLLDLTKLGLDQGEACVFALEFTTQPIWQRMTFRGLEGGKVDPGPAQLRLDVTDILGKQESLDPIDKACAFPDKTLTLPMRAAKALCSGLSSGCWRRFLGGTKSEVNMNRRNAIFRVQYNH